MAATTIPAPFRRATATAIGLIIGLLLLLPIGATPAAAGPLEDITCRVESNVFGVDWWMDGLDQGDLLRLFRSDHPDIVEETRAYGPSWIRSTPSLGATFAVEVVRDAGSRRVECGEGGALDRIPLDGVTCRATLSDLGLPTIEYQTPVRPSMMRDGEVIEPNLFPGSPYRDLSVSPRTTYEYALLLHGLTQPDEIVPCGSVTVGDVDLAGLVATAEAQVANMLGPFVNATVTVICPTDVECPTGLIEVDWNRVSERPDELHRPDLLPALPAAHPGYLGIPETHQVLLAAIAEGRRVEATFDTRGVPLAWTIDDYGLSVSCLVTDTLPHELQTRACSEWHLTNLVHDAVTLDEVVRSSDLIDADRAVLRLYQAILGRAPDGRGAVYWILERRRGLDLESMARYFLASPEATGRFGAETDAEFLERVYDNVFDRAPDADGRRYWADVLADGHARADVIVWMSANREFIDRFPFDPVTDESA